MRDCELQILGTAKVFDQKIKAAGLLDSEASSVVPGSRLHEIRHNPIDRGIDEG